MDFVNFVNFQKKTKLLKKSEVPEKRGFKFQEKRFLPPGQPPFIN